MAVARKEQIIAKINKILLEDFEIKKELIRPESELIKDIEIDSLDFVDFIVAIERNFGLKVDSEDLANIKTVNDLYEFISKKKNG
jgi:acyl carrier protein